ncbi:MAG: hypothetical protein Q9169_006104 [Polycauliona sp. 2 TL-2023]
MSGRGASCSGKEAEEEDDNIGIGVVGFWSDISGLTQPPNSPPKSTPRNHSTAPLTLPSSLKPITPIVRCSVPHGLTALLATPSDSLPPRFGALIVDLDLDVETFIEKGFTPAFAPAASSPSPPSPPISSLNRLNDPSHCALAVPLVSGRQRKCVSGGRGIGFGFGFGGIGAFSVTVNKR